jgi:hypothetical protein
VRGIEDPWIVPGQFAQVFAVDAQLFGRSDDIAKVFRQSSRSVRAAEMG